MVEFTEPAIIQWVLALPSDVNPYLATAEFLMTTLRVSEIGWCGWAVTKSFIIRNHRQSRFWGWLSLTRAWFVAHSHFKGSYGSGDIYPGRLHNVSALFSVNIFSVVPAVLVTRYQFESAWSFSDAMVELYPGCGVNVAWLFTLKFERKGSACSSWTHVSAHVKHSPAVMKRCGELAEKLMITLRRSEHYHQLG